MVKTADEAESVPVARTVTTASLELEVGVPEMIPSELTLIQSALEPSLEKVISLLPPRTRP